jgi:hypothetical protein
MKDYYYILGVDRSCSVDIIKKAYRKLSHKFHPDKNDGDTFFAERFKEINEAYEILSNSTKREQYDKLKPESSKKERNYSNNFEPKIEYFKSDCIEVEYNGDILISWKTINADKVSIDALGNVEPIGTKKYKFQNLNLKEISLKIIATNSYINKSVSSTIVIANKTYYEFYQKVKTEFYEKVRKEESHSVQQLIPYRRGKKWGFCKHDKEIIVDFIYDEVQPFSEGLAAVNRKGKWGYIGETGSELIECKYDTASLFNGGLGLVSINYKKGFIDKSGSTIIPCKYFRTTSIGDELIGVTEFTILQEILLSLRLVSDNIYYNWIINSKSKPLICCYIDKKGNQVFSSEFTSIGPFKEGLALVELNSKYGYIDKTGKIAIPCKFYKASSFDNDLAGVKIFKQSKSLETSTMYINKKGVVQFECKYDDVFSFSEGLARVEVNGNSFIGKSGYINQKGEEVIPCKYDEANDFAEGLAAVGLNGKYISAKYGYIDKSDNLIISFKYDSADDFKNGIAKVRLNGLYGYINKHGVEYWEI